VVVAVVADLVGTVHKVRFLELVVQAVAEMAVVELALLTQRLVQPILVVGVAVLKYGITVVVYSPALLVVQVLWSYATPAPKEALEELLFLAVAIPTIISIHLVHTQHRVQTVNHGRRTRIRRWCQGDQRGV
jgi:hypothetical protein